MKIEVIELTLMGETPLDISIQLFSPSILALNKTMAKLAGLGASLEDYDYKNAAIADIILNEIAKLQFTGMSVRKKMSMNNVEK